MYLVFECTVLSLSLSLSLSPSLSLSLSLSLAVSQNRNFFPNGGYQPNEIFTARQRIVVLKKNFQ